MLNWSSSAKENFNIRQKLDLFVRGHSYWIFPQQFTSNWREWVAGSNNLGLRFDTFFNLKKEIYILAWIKANLKTFNIAKNQEFELIIYTMLL